MPAAHLLVIEDDPPSRSMLVRGLERLGYAADGAADAFEARSRLVAGGTAGFDGILVDLRLPRMDGLEFMAWLEAADPTLGAILLSAQETEAMQDNREHPTLLRRMHKPVPFPELDKAVREVVAFTRDHRNKVSGSA